MVDIPDVVNYTNFGDHRLRGFWVAGGQISPFPVRFAAPCRNVFHPLLVPSVSKRLISNCNSNLSILSDFTVSWLEKAPLSAFSFAVISLSTTPCNICLSVVKTCSSSRKWYYKKAVIVLYTTTRSSAIAEGPRDAPCQLKPCKMSHKCSLYCM